MISYSLIFLVLGEPGVSDSIFRSFHLFGVLPGILKSDGSTDRCSHCGLGYTRVLPLHRLEAETGVDLKCQQYDTISVTSLYMNL